LSHRIAASEGNAAEQQRLKKELAQALNVNMKKFV
jgi:hypothetical protein